MSVAFFEKHMPQIDTKKSTVNNVRRIVSSWRRSISLIL